MMKTRLKRAAYILLTAGLCMFGSMTAFADSEVDANPAVYVSGTTINGVNVSGLTPEEAKARVEQFLKESYELTVVDSSGRETIISHQDIGLSAVVKGGLAEVLAKENEGGRQSGPSADNSYSIDLEITYDENALTERLKSLKCMTSGVIETKDAHISAYEEGKEFTIVPEVKGNSVNWERLNTAVKTAIGSGQRWLSLYDAGCYDKVNVYSDNEELKKLCDTMNQYRTMTVNYVFGEESEKLDGAVIASWIQGSSGTDIMIDREKAAAYVNALAEKYNTAGKERTFKTTAGNEVKVTGPYGWRMDTAAETEALLNVIKAGQSIDREPIYSQSAAGWGTNEYGSTYVEIDLGNQHVYLYKDGACILDAPCVTGNVSKGWTTPPGIFGLYYKQRDRVLKGEDYATPVSYWMPFNGGIGLHDANWRGQFGGGIYKTSGSHGCINLPPQKAAQLYEHVYKNMPVICYN
ncbi:L,D-transpeptidase family protein [Clostridium sp. AM58-1XD]|uniref:L,D-transpeptidase family protein n=1 Tax=Clostridium sp. AM58-1XD TaxID=2292307 RepID=UPI000E484AD3|nr:L,D-transpeptidase family protein [Clostridium sp. AM58-1XD]RGY97509.1 hypothetical protein DXA13_14215 [Clostridium sp. AM58-1XD]